MGLSDGFLIDLTGPFTETEIHTQLVSYGRSASENLDSLIETEWNVALNRAEAAKKTLFNGELLRLNKYSVSSRNTQKILNLDLGPTSYKDFVGSNLNPAAEPESFSDDSLANPLGTSVILKTADGSLVFGLRSDSVFYHAGYVQTFGGTLETQDIGKDGQVSVFDSIRREVLEELPLQDSELVVPYCLALVRDCEIRQPEMIFQARAAISYDEIKRRWDDKIKRRPAGIWEHVDLVRLCDSEEGIRTFLQEGSPITPVVAAALHVHKQLHV